jgi:hypothetical protein
VDCVSIINTGANTTMRYSSSASFERRRYKSCERLSRISESFLYAMENSRKRCS